MILTLATVLVTSRQYIGDPIDCMVDVSLLIVSMCINVYQC